MKHVNPVDAGATQTGPRRNDRGTDIYIGARVEERREQLDLSQQQVATLLHVTDQQLARFERGAVAIPPDILKSLAQTLTVSVAWFFFGLMIDIGTKGARHDNAAAPPDTPESPPLQRKRMCDELNQMAWSLARQALARQSMVT